MPVEEDIVKGICPECGKDKNATVKGEEIRKTSYEDESLRFSVDFSTKYRILKCRGCDLTYCQRIDYCSEWESGDDYDSYYETTYWPAETKRVKPEWLNDISDRILHGVLSELYTALDNGLSVLAAIGIRTAIDRATELLKIDSRLKFFEKLNELESQDFLTSKDRKTFDVLIDAGSAAAHRAWKPKEKQLNVMMQILEGFLHKHFISPEEVEALRSGVPPKPSRKKGKSGSTST